MPSSDPSAGEQYYQLVGANPTDSREDILDLVKKEKNKKKLEIKNERGSGNTNKAKKVQDEYLDLKDAEQWIENNHPKDGFDEPTSLSLTIENNAEVQQPVKFKVIGKDGPEEGVTVRTDKGHEKKTTSSGTVEFTFSNTGDVSAETEDGWQYDGDSVSFYVSERTVTPRFASIPDTLEAYDTGVIEVVDDDMNPLDGISIICDGNHIGKTKNGGKFEKEFEDHGTKEIEATAKNTDNIRYESATETITVTIKEIPLNLQMDSRSPEVNENVTFRVVDNNGTHVNGVNVEAKDGPSGTTSDDGTTVITFTKARMYEMSASKKAADDSVEYDGETVQLQVGEADSGLYIGETKGDFRVMETVEIQVVDDWDRPVEKVEISTNHNHDTSTDDDGWTNLELSSSEDLKVVGEKDGEHIDFDNLETGFEVSEADREIHIKGLPDVARPGGEVDIQVVDEESRPIASAEIRSTEQQLQTWETDDQGEATVQLANSYGMETFTADKSGVSFLNGISEERVLLRDV